MLVKIKDVCQVVSGATPSTNNSSYYDGNIFWITPKDLADNNNRKYINDCGRKITTDGYNSCSTVMIPKNNILISTRAPIGYMAINRVECCTNQGFKSLICDTKKVVVDYLFYLLKSRMNEIELLGSGTTFKEVSKTSIENFEIELPSLEAQEQIASILSQIDNQIERNNAMVKKLQVLSQAIYNYYFLQYEFPDKNGNPYKKSGGSFVYNNIIDRKIPHGWNVIKLSAECKIRLGGTPDTSVNEYWDGKINWLNSGEIAQFPVTCSELKITQAGVDNSATKLMKKGTVVVSITGNIRASILGLDSCANQSVVGIEETKLLKKSYLYPNIYNQLEHFTSISAGNCQKHINKGTLEKLNIVIPEISVLEDYYNKCERLYNQIISLKQSADKLITLKNKLLPLLINQQLG